MSTIVQQAPRFSEKEAIRIARELYGLDAVARLLPSERDQNFALNASDAKTYVLKLANSTERLEVLDFQNQAMIHIAKKKNQLNFNALTVQEVYADVNGAQVTTVEGPDGASHYVRLLSYLPGKPLARVKPHDKNLFASLGRFFGNLDLILEDFDHPAAHRDFHWDLKNAGRIIAEYIDLVKDPESQRIVRRMLERFQTETEPQMSDLRTSVIHNDGNDYNVLVQLDRWQHKVTGVIDFGDMVHTQTVNEVAIVCAYAMLDKVDFLAAAASIVSGYNQVVPLSESELDVLYDLICMRLCMSVCHSANQYRHDPDNEYLRISEKPAWALIKKMAKIHSRFACYTFRHACGLPPVPRHATVISYLKQNSGRFGKLVDENLRSGDQLVLDLSAGSQLLGSGGDGFDLAEATAKIFGKMQAESASVAIGRYAEARLIYKAHQFAVQTDEMPEHRTVHLGIDLYMPSTSKVFAPLDGKVHSFGNNSDHLDYGPTIILEHQMGSGICFYTLYGHLNPDCLDNLKVGMTVAKGDIIARVGEPQTNGGWPPHLHFQIIVDMFEENGNYPGVARPSERAIWTSICPDPNFILGIPADCFPSEGRSSDEILAYRKKSLGRNLSISYDSPLKIVRGERQYLYSADGQAFLDGVNNVCHVGHCHPHVVAAGQLQMPVLNTNTRYLHDNIIDYSRRLLSRFPEPLSVCYFVCSGSEANELALRMARTFTGRHDIITVDGAYHGNTQTLIDISPYKHDGPGGSGTPAWVHKVIMPDGYRGPHKGKGADVGARYAEYVRDTIDRIQNSGKSPAAFICESMLGCGGQIVLPEKYLREAFKYVRAAGGICIVDEVQVGFGRVGSHFWAFETQDIVPDIVTLGKPIGNGHPLAAVITTPEIADAFANGMEYFNTFGGNPVSCAIGMAVMDVIENERLQQNAFKAGKRLLEGLGGLMDKYALIGDVRGLGLYIGVELVTDRKTLNPATEHADYIINRMREHGILISTDGPMENVLKVKPPIVFTEKNADKVVEVLDKVLKEDCLQV